MNNRITISVSYILSIYILSMNLFILSLIPREVAQAMMDKHIV
jgi:hypothetical protein